MYPEAYRTMNPDVIASDWRSWAGYFVKSALTGALLGAAIGYKAGNNDNRGELMLKIGAATGVVFLLFPTITMIRGGVAPVVTCDDSIRNVATRTVGNVLLGIIAGGGIAAAIPSLVYGRNEINRDELIHGAMTGGVVLGGLEILGSITRKVMPPRECLPPAV